MQTYKLLAKEDLRLTERLDYGIFPCLGEQTRQPGVLWGGMRLLQHQEFMSEEVSPVK